MVSTQTEMVSISSVQSVFPPKAVSPICLTILYVPDCRNCTLRLLEPEVQYAGTVGNIPPDPKLDPVFNENLLLGRVNKFH